MDKALVLFSGGQDSATCLAWACRRFGHVETLGFDYGQRHRVELEQRPVFLEAFTEAFPRWAARLGTDTVLDLAALGQVSETALTRDTEIVMSEAGPPSSFVPGRNLIFLTFAAALAYRRGIRHIVTGVCETDYSGYPDCRDDTIKALQVALNLGMDSRFVLHTPLMWIDKPATWAMAEELGGAPLVEMIREKTHSCYLACARPATTGVTAVATARPASCGPGAGSGTRSTDEPTADLRGQGDLSDLLPIRNRLPVISPNPLL